MMSIQILVFGCLTCPPDSSVQMGNRVIEGANNIDVLLGTYYGDEAYQIFDRMNPTHDSAIWFFCPDEARTFVEDLDKYLTGEKRIYDIWRFPEKREDFTELVQSLKEMLEESFQKNYDEYTVEMWY